MHVRNLFSSTILFILGAASAHAQPGSDNGHALTSQAGMASHSGQSLSTAAVTSPPATTTEQATTVAQIERSEYGVRLGAQLYQEGDIEAALEALAISSRLYPDDPTPPLTAAIIAIDRARAGLAIEQSREALARLLRTGRGAPEEAIATIRTGIGDIGAAQTNLNLNDWGTYYGQLAFDPFSPNSLLFFASTYPSEAARNAATTQALLLDPTAVSAPNRYVDLIRRPASNVTLSGTIGKQKEAFLHGETAQLQGYAEIPQPLSYALSFAADHNEGFRENAETSVLQFSADLGGWIDQPNAFLVRAGFFRDKQGLPGPVTSPDLDDRERTRVYAGEIGFQHRINDRNIVLARLAASRTEVNFRNDDPLGTGLTNLDASLISAFGANPAGVEAVRSLYRVGLVSDNGFLGGTPETPVILIGPAIEFVPGATLLASRIPAANFDLNGLRSADTRENQLSAQLRHLFDVGPVFDTGDLELTYGAEASYADVTHEQVNTGLQLTGQGALLFPDGGVEGFLFGTLGENRTTRNEDTKAGLVYVAGRWTAGPQLAVDLGAAVRHYDAGQQGEKTYIDPRFGVAWQVLPDQYFRFAVQQELRLPIIASLAPAATVGLVAPDTYLTPGGRSTDVRLRWDAEWSKNVFTFVEAAEQWIDNFTVTIPLASERARFFLADQGRICSMALGTNVWFAERFGAFGVYRRNWSENQSENDPGKGKYLPLVPRQVLDLGLTYVDPSDLRISITESFVGERAADPQNTGTLSSYWVTGANLLWQILDRHLAFRLSVENLFDRRFETARGFPAPGRTVLTGLELRW